MGAFAACRDRQQGPRKHANGPTSVLFRDREMLKFISRSLKWPFFFLLYLIFDRMPILLRFSYGVFLSVTPLTGTLPVSNF